jgi:hypothetical protein
MPMKRPRRSFSAIPIRRGQALPHSDVALVVRFRPEKREDLCIAGRVPVIPGSKVREHAVGGPTRTH